MTCIINDRYSLTEYLFEDVEGIIPILDRNNSVLYKQIKRFVGHGPEFFRFSPFKKEDRRKLSQLGAADKIVIFGIDLSMIRYVSKKYPKVKSKYVYLWDPCSKLFSSKSEIERFRNSCIELGFKVYTFDKEDAKKNDLGYNPQLYVLKSCKNPYPDYDSFFFCGYEKGRGAAIQRFRELLTPFGNCDFVVVNSQTQELSYTECIRRNLSSKAICDIVQTNQSGLTIRAIEGLFYHKKVITNNQNIVKSPVYHPSNYFVIDENTTSVDIKHFLDEPYVTLDNSLTDFYSIKEWVKRFK